MLETVSDSSTFDGVTKAIIEESIAGVADENIDLARLAVLSDAYYGHLASESVSILSAI